MNHLIDHIMFAFEAQLEIIGINPFVFVPRDILDNLFKDAGTNKGYIPVKGKVNERDYVQTLLRFRGEWRLYINTVILSNSPKRIGETLAVTIAFDPENRTILPHPELEAAFALNKEALQVFDGLSPSKQKEIIRYISSLKTADSRRKNIERAIGFLLGKNRFVGREKP